MKVSLPYSRRKRYLTGIDWIIAALGRLTRRHTGVDNASQLVLHLDGAFDAERFRAAVAELSDHLPQLGGRIARDWNLAPYWQLPSSRRWRRPVVETTDIAPTDLPAALARIANTPFPDARTHLAFHLLRMGPERRVLVMRFDHAVMDAHGAEAFLDLLRQCGAGADARALVAPLAVTEPAHLDHWQRKFEAGRQFVRFLRGLSSARLMVLPRPKASRGRGFRFLVVSFDEAETAAIVARAQRTAGFLMFMPYTLAAAVRIIYGLLQARNVSGDEIVVSLSTDVRTPDTAASRVLFNHLSFLFFHVPRTLIADFPALVASLREQMYEQVKTGFPQALHESSMLMRIVPLGVASRALLWPLKGEMATMGFTCVGRADDTRPILLGAEVTNLIHMPLVPTPPGLGFVVNQFRRRLNVTLAWAHGMLDDAEVDRLRTAVRETL